MEWLYDVGHWTNRLSVILFDNNVILFVRFFAPYTLFSLNTFSPTTFTGGAGSVSPADILYPDFTSTFSVWATAGDLGLFPDDELNALALVPAPSKLLLLGRRAGRACGILNTAKRLALNVEVRSLGTRRPSGVLANEPCPLLR